MNPNSKVFRDGKRRLKDMLGRAKAEARKTDSGHCMEANSLLGQSVMNHIKEKNFEALVVYEDGPGKWYGDLVMKGLPPGVPSVLGTATSTPRASAAEATSDCYMILVGILRNMRERDAKTKGKPLEDLRVFSINDFELSIPKDAIDTALVLSEIPVEGGYGADEALEFVARVVDEICEGREFDEEVFKGLTDKQHAALKAAAAVALIHGEFRYPRRANSSPDKRYERPGRPTAH